MKAIHQKPSGFSDPRYYESEVEIVGYCSSGETVLAVFKSGDRLDCAPLKEFRVACQDDDKWIFTTEGGALAPVGHRP